MARFSIGAASAGLVALLTFSPNAEATTVKLMSLLEKTEACPAVVHGIVERIETRWELLDTRLETRVTLVVVESIKGNFTKGERITFTRGGGTLGDFTQTAPGLSEYREGEEVVMFLEPLAETFVAIGIGIGKYEVENRPGGKVVIHDPKVAAVRLHGDKPIEVVEHPTMEPEPLHLFLKKVRSYARGLPLDPPIRPRKGATIKQLQVIE